MLGLAFLALVGTACSRQTSVKGLDASPASLEPIRPRAIRSCRDVPTLGPAWPKVMPAAAEEVRAFDAYVGGTWGFVVEAGESGIPSDAPSPGPPEMVELHVFAGPDADIDTDAMRHARNFKRPLERRGTPWLIDPDVSWGGRDGAVVLLPKRRRLSPGHLAYVWSQDGVHYRVSVAAWDPLEESVATLREIVESAG